tara:strand:- start:786 stop:1085 length:300 start_codon:yes stop_codon:yes gene_type:complete
MVQLNSLLNNNPELIIMVGAQYCNPCKKLTPLFESYKNTYNNKTFIKLDLEEDERICEKIEIEKIPTLIYYKEKECIIKEIVKNNSEMCSIMNKIIQYK